MIGLAGKPALEFVKAFRPLRKGVTLYALSVLGTSANIKALGPDAIGMAVSQVVPLPTNTIVPVVRVSTGPQDPGRSDGGIPSGARRLYQCPRLH